MEETSFIDVFGDGQIAAVVALAQEIWTEHYSPIIGKEQVDYMLSRFQSKEAISGQIKSGSLYFLIEENRRFIGYLAAQPKEDALFLSKIYVLKSMRRKGYGRKAVEFIERLTREKGFKKIDLTVNKMNAGSIRAYEKIGFRNTGPVVQDIGSGFVMDDFRMEKTL